MENPIKMDVLGVPPFSETSKYLQTRCPSAVRPGTPLMPPGVSPVRHELPRLRPTAAPAGSSHARPGATMMVTTNTSQQLHLWKFYEKNWLFRHDGHDP